MKNKVKNDYKGFVSVNGKKVHEIDCVLTFPDVQKFQSRYIQSREPVVLRKYFQDSEKFSWKQLERALTGNTMEVECRKGNES